MIKGKTIGLILISISMLLSLANILKIDITGAVIGVGIKSAPITIFTLILFIGGLIFLSSLEKKIIALAIATGTIIGGGSKIVKGEREKQYIEDTKITASYKTELGKFQRTYRWDDVLDKTEEKYDLPKGLLKGLAMRESYGDPLRLNEGADGGAGLFMFQPRTAKAYGLKVYGSSNKSSADTIHGKELRRLIKKNKNDYTKMAKIDERFSIRKSSEAAAHYLKNEYDKHGSWDKALSAYNQGTPAPNPKTTKHVKAVREYQRYYNKRDKH
jgi:hypothetical protein